LGPIDRVKVVEMTNFKKNLLIFILNRFYVSIKAWAFGESPKTTIFGLAGILYY